MKYAVIMHEEIPVLVKHVNAALEEGWVCQGGVTAVKTGNAFGHPVYRYCQAMTLANVITRDQAAAQLARERGH